MTKYDEVMEKLEVTPEMRARILQNVETQMAEPCKKPNRLRRFAALAACLAILLVGAAALPKLISSPAPEESETTIANGMVEVASKEELSEAVGFPVKSAQSLPFFPQSIYYTSYWGEMAQIDYANGGSTAMFPAVSWRRGQFRRLERIPRAEKPHRKRLRRDPQGGSGQLYACHLAGRDLQLFAQPVCRSAGLRLGDLLLRG